MYHMHPLRRGMQVGATHEDRTTKCHGHHQYLCFSRKYEKNQSINQSIRNYSFPMEITYNNTQQSSATAVLNATA